MRGRVALLISSIVIACSGCAGRYDAKLNFNPSEPIRIAVLPFAQVDDKGNLTRTDENALIDNVSAVSSKLKTTPAQFVQNLVQSELSGASLDVLPPGLVDSKLLHAGFYVLGANPVTMDVPKVFAANPTELCTKVLSCDAVLLGKVTSWDRSYYGIQAVATVGIDLQLISARTNKVLYQVAAKDSDSRGLTKGPTGFSDIVIEPFKGLDNEIITDLARRIVTKAVAPLLRTSKPEFLTSAPPAILAAAHDANRGVIPKNGKLLVIAFGSPGQTGNFDVGTVAQGVPLVERAPGHYVGEFVPLASDSFANATVTVRLRDEFGRATLQPLSKVPVSY